MSDPYVYPGTTILINKSGLQTQDELDHFERVMTFARLSEPIPKVPITYDGYKALHHHIFQDVFEWAGQSRTVPLAKGKTFFGPPMYVDQEMLKRFDLIAKENYLHNLDAELFSIRVAEHLNEINAIHPFREGNGRTQRLFLEVLSDQTGHHLRSKDIHPEPWNEASVKGFEGRHEFLGELILAAIQRQAHTQSQGSQQEPNIDLEQ